MKQFTFLGAVFTNDNDDSVEMKRRIAVAKMPPPLSLNMDRQTFLLIARIGWVGVHELVLL